MKDSQRRMADHPDKADLPPYAHLTEGDIKRLHRYRALFDQSPVPSILIGADAHIREVNHSAERLLDYTHDWFVGQPLARLFPPQAESVLPPDAFSAVRSEGVVEATAHRRDGRGIPVRLHWTSIDLEDGPHLLLSLLDITERIRAQKTRAVMQQIAEAVNEADSLDTFFPTIRQILGTLLDTANFRIALYDPHEDRITLPYIVDEQDSYTSFAGGKTATAHVIHSGKPLLLTPQTRARLEKEGGLEPVGAPAKAWMGVPLRIEGTVIGAMVVQSYSDPDRFSAGQVDLLAEVSDQVALAIQRKRAEDARRDSESRYRSIFESTTDAVVIFDARNEVVEANPNACRLYGYDRAEFIGLSAAKLVDPASFHGFANVKDRIEAQGHFVADSINRRRDGSTFDVQIHATQFTFDGRPHLLSVVRDTSERARAERALWQTSEKIERLHDVARELEACEVEADIYRITVGASEKILDFAFCSLDLVEDGRLVVKATSSELPPGASRSTPLAEGGIAAKTHAARRTIAFGSLADVPEARPSQSSFASGISAPIGEFGVFQVVSVSKDAFTQQDVRLLELLLGHTAEAIKRIRLQRNLREQAIRDPLTGVYNRRHFNFIIEQEKRRAMRYDHAIGFLMIDVNRFKEINDRFGHQIGDSVLRTTAKLLANEIRETDLVVRYGGDEFLIILLETNGETGLVKNRIRAAVTRRNQANELIPFPVTFAIGESHWTPRKGQSISETLAEADRRMYEDKRPSGV